MRILLIEPPSFGEAWEYSISSRENLGLGYLASKLRLDGHVVEVVCCPAFDWSIADIQDRLRDFRPDLVGVSLPFTDEMKGTYGPLRELAEFVGPQVPIIAGGHAATLSARQLLFEVPEITAVVRGEGELTFAEVAGRLQQGLDFGSVRSLSIRSGDQVCSNPNRELVSNLDSLPFPARDLLHTKRAMGKMPEEIYLSGSRGCPYRCSFCDIKTFYKNGKGTSWRGRSAQNIVEELRGLHAEFGSEPVYCFVDDQFIGPGSKGREQAREFAQQLFQSSLEISFEVSCRADTVDRETFSLLKQAGLSGVYFGLESGSQAALDRFQKDTTVERNLEGVALLRELEIGVDFGFIMFDPWTTTDELLDNLAFLKRIATLGVPLHPSVLLNTLKFYPDTEIEKARDSTVVVEGSGFVQRVDDARLAQVHSELKELMAFVADNSTNVSQSSVLSRAFMTEIEQLLSIGP